MIDHAPEEILEPDLPIVDPHHHLWEARGPSETPARHGLDRMLELSLGQMLEHLLAYMNSGHDMHATVFMDCRAMYRAVGPEAFRPLDETEYANSVGAMCASGACGPRLAWAGIVSRVDLLLGDAAGEVLEAQLARATDRLRGIRNVDPGTPIPRCSDRLRGGRRRGSIAARPSGLA